MCVRGGTEWPRGRPVDVGTRAPARLMTVEFHLPAIPKRGSGITRSFAREEQIGALVLLVTQPVNLHQRDTSRVVHAAHNRRISRAIGRQRFDER